MLSPSRISPKNTVGDLGKNFRGILRTEVRSVSPEWLSAAPGGNEELGCIGITQTRNIYIELFLIVIVISIVVIAHFVTHSPHKRYTIHAVSLPT